MGGKLDWSEHINRQTVIFTNYTLQESVKGPRKRMGMGGGGQEKLSATPQSGKPFKRLESELLAFCKWGEIRIAL